MSVSKLRQRIHSSHIERADELREPYHYHLPDAPIPPRQLIVGLALRKGLRSLAAHLERRVLVAAVLKDEPARDQIKVRVPVDLLQTADQLRSALWNLQRAQRKPGEPAPRYPSRGQVVAEALDLGLEAMERTYQTPDYQKAAS